MLTTAKFNWSVLIDNDTRRTKNELIALAESSLARILTPRPEGLRHNVAATPKITMNELANVLYGTGAVNDIDSAIDFATAMLEEKVCTKVHGRINEGWIGNNYFVPVMNQSSPVDNRVYRMFTSYTALPNRHEL